jgi:hypothetical protein
VPNPVESTPKLVSTVARGAALPEQKQRFTQAAEAAGMDVSAFMRNATIEKIERR